MPDNMTPNDDNFDDELSVEYGDVETLLRSLDVDDLADHEPPPARVWGAIEHELGAELTDNSRSAVPTDPTPLTAGAEVVDLTARRRSRFAMLSIAAALVLIVVGAAVVLNRSGDGEVVASARLTFDPASYDPLGEGRSATADLLDADGAYVIDLAEADLPTDLGEDADLEIWLLAIDDGAVADLVSLGLVDADDPGSFDVPEGYDPAVYRDVDISVEPRDGDRTHSGRTILRGPLGEV